jgi:AcrR family transcriptional regulator
VTAQNIQNPGKRAVRRQEIISVLAAYLLESGLSDAGLRKLAVVAGTSDRMLLYYFEDKDELLTAVLMETGKAMEVELSGLLGSARLKPTVALEALWQMVRGEIFANHLRLWLEMSGQAGRGDPLFATIVSSISEGWVRWLSGILDTPEAGKTSLAALILAAVNGQLIMYPGDLTKGDPAIAALKKMLASGVSKSNNQHKKKTEQQGVQDERKSRRAVQLPGPTGRHRRMAGSG